MRSRDGKSRSEIDAVDGQIVINGCLLLHQGVLLLFAGHPAAVSCIQWVVDDLLLQ